MGERAQQAFEATVPAHLQEDVMQMIAEAAGGWCDHPSVTILDRDRHDAINVTAHGIVMVEGVEHRFIVDDGNWNGTVLRDWDGDAVFEYRKPTTYALQPEARLIDEAIMAGKGPLLLMKWDAILSNHQDIAAIPGKYAYDRYFQPGIKVESHWREAAAKHHFVIVDEETAQETRKRLASPSQESSRG
ncbi:hypothetical protein [Bosea minatitlanensis]|uniref:Uncharacterized protein n=1 Tax=Bosea minatitlanensis TaxID=128782 RepID=A0ABW0F292_9HYPH|nr:hypothetical protein [Bosea minatitlanensis]MCT4492683.1 hypothetical protein [Bosea minatitlanensis]